MKDDRLRLVSWHLRFLVLALMAGGSFSGCCPVQFARSPIEQSDPRIAGTLSGYWRGTAVSHTFEVKKPAGSVILKSLPDGKSLVHFHGLGLVFTGVISWTEVEGAYLGYADGMAFESGQNDEHEAYAFNMIVLVRPNRDGTQFVVRFPQPVTRADYRELQAGLDRFDVGYRGKGPGIIIDDTPDKMLGWLRSYVREYEGDPSGYTIYERITPLTTSGAEFIKPVVAPKPRARQS